MKKLGIIGGAGPLASALLYETVVHEAYSLGCKIPEILLINYPFTRGLSQDEGRRNQQTLRSELLYCLEILADNGVKMALLACNTLHLTLKELNVGNICFQHIPEMVLKVAEEQKHNHLLILGTGNTCGSDLYRLPGIEVAYPSVEEQCKVGAIIDRVLEGKIRQEDGRSIEIIIKEISKRYVIDGVVLGCTELPVLHHHFPIKTALPIYDSIKIPAKKIVGLL